MDFLPGSHTILPLNAFQWFPPIKASLRPLDHDDQVSLLGGFKTGDITPPLVERVLETFFVAKSQAQQVAMLRQPHTANQRQGGMEFLERTRAD